METRSSSRHIPLEIVEEILLNLPVKSLLRFRSVSKSWKSKIFEPWFIRKHLSRSRAARKTLVMQTRPWTYFDIIPTDPSSKSNYYQPRNPVSPLPGNAHVKAFCEELWCVELSRSMHLWNPLMGKCKELPDSMPLIKSASKNILSWYRGVDAVYGLGYDAVNDDYKLLKAWESRSGCFSGTLVYSLRSDSWRETHQHFPGLFPGLLKHSSSGEFVNGALHWMVERIPCYRVDEFGNGNLDLLGHVIVSFDLSTEKYKEVAQPPCNIVPSSTHLAVLREMLWVCMDYRGTTGAFVMWAMKEYGVKESWTKMYDIRHDSRVGESILLMPLYVHENGAILIWIHDAGGYELRPEEVDDNEMDDGDYEEQHEIVIYKDMQFIAQENIPPVNLGAFVYVESLISPATWQ